MSKSHFLMPFRTALRKIFKPVYGDLKTRRNWEVIAAALFAEPPEPGDLAIFKQLTGRSKWPTKPFCENYNRVGRRGGKSSFSAAVGVYIATMADYSKVLSPGESAHVVLLAVDRSQAKVLLGYVKAYFREIDMLKQMVIRETADGVELSNGCIISVHTSSFRSIRGRTFAAIIMDELAYWLPVDAEELIAAARPGMTTIPWAMLVGISTPYMREGPFYEEVVEHWGDDNSSTLVVRATSQQMNETLLDDVIKKALRQDPERAGAEYLDQDRSALSAAFPRDRLDANLCLPDKAIPPPDHPYWTLTVFVDVSAGRNDAGTICITKMEQGSDIITVLLIARWPAPHSPASVIAEMAVLIKKYNLRVATGDGYAAQMTVDLFAQNGIQYQRSELNKSQIYVECLPLVMTDSIEGPNNETLKRELMGLQRRTRAGGRDIIDHANGQHDDMANSFAGACVFAWRGRTVNVGEITFGAPLVSANHEGGLTGAFTGNYPRLTNDW